MPCAAPAHAHLWDATRRRTPARRGPQFAALTVPDVMERLSTSFCKDNATVGFPFVGALFHALDRDGSGAIVSGTASYELTKK